MLVKVYGSAVFGVEATTITVEVNMSKGIAYNLVGLPDNAIKESSFRIAAALQNNTYKFPLFFPHLTFQKEPELLQYEYQYGPVGGR